MVTPVPMRASSFVDLLDCAHRFEARNILGMRSPASPQATLGTAVHAGAAAFDKREVEFVDAIDVARELVLNPAEPVHWNAADLSRNDAVTMAGVMTGAYCKEFKDTEWAAVELTFNPLVIDVDGVQIELTGSTDRIRRDENGLLATGDLKTGAGIVKPDGSISVGQYRIQLAIYELLAEQDLGLKMTDDPFIIGIQSAKTNPMIRTAPISGARDALLGTDGKPGVLQMAAAMLKTGMFPPNPRSNLCSKKFCPRFSTCTYK